MRRYCVLLLLFLAACGVVQQVEEAPQEAEPLDVSLSSEVTSAELELKTTLECSASGGTEPYRYDWDIENDSIVASCQEQCEVSLQRIGRYSVSCAVTDARGRTAGSASTLEVLKEQVDVDSVVAFGDSLTAGFGVSDNETWPYLNSERLDADLDNYAVSGATTFDVIRQVETFNSSTGEKMIFLWVGANDAKKLFEPSVFRNNYEQLLEKLSEVENAHVFVMTIPDASRLPVAEDVENDVNRIAQRLGFGQISVRGLVQEVISVYNRIIKQTAEEHDVTVIEMYQPMEAMNDTLITEDGFHPNEQGHKRIEERIRTRIEEAHPRKEFR